MKCNLANHMALGVFAAVTLVMTGSIAEAKEKKPVYSLAIIVDAAEGRSVKRGSYEQAIGRLSSAKRYSRSDKFARQTNLCVAYTKTGDLENAEIACDKAVTMVADSAADESDRNLALALTNRGVLRAIQGETELALADFESAFDLRYYVRLAKTNLARVAKELPTQG